MSNEDVVEIVVRGLLTLSNEEYQRGLYGRHMIRHIEFDHVNATEWWWTSAQATNGGGEISCIRTDGNLNNRLEFKITIAIDDSKFYIAGNGSTVIDPTTFEPVTSYWLKVNQ